MRRIPQTAGFRISEDANRVKVSSDSPNRSITFEIEAPARTNLKLSTVNGGEILVENIEGELDRQQHQWRHHAEQRGRNGQRRHHQRQRSRDHDARDRGQGHGLHFVEWHRGRDAAAGDQGQPADAQRQRRRLFGFRRAAGGVSAGGCRKTAAATAAIASAATARSSAPSTAADRSSSCGRSTATSTFGKAVGPKAQVRRRYRRLTGVNQWLPHPLPRQLNRRAVPPTGVRTIRLPPSVSSNLRTKSTAPLSSCPWR